MDTVMGDFERSDVDAEMTALTPEDSTEQNLDGSDEVEHLRNSLREAVHDDNVRPKMQCLMMDSSFSMVTMQGEDSGIEWETTPSRCNTPWASEAGNSLTVDPCSSVPVRPATPGSFPAGKIIFVMDEELISRRKKTKERVRKADRQRELLMDSSENISGRPELVEYSQPNVKTEGEGDEEDANDPRVDKEQRLFRLVSEGSEILNIVVPPKLATVDEEESKVMVDNLSYLEESTVAKAAEDTQDYEMISDAERADQAEARRISATNVMDPPGAPVAKPVGVKGAGGNVDYFEAFTMVDAQAPGSPAVIDQGKVEEEVDVANSSQDTEISGNSKTTTPTPTPTAVDNDKIDTISLEEMTSEQLDEVFYGGTESPKSLEREEVTTPVRLPSKPSGSNLFEGQDEILTPIFLPEGPPKIIDQILLEEPQAMAFHYTDLYEEAVGSYKKEEDAESMTSEKSFHSRHSDREARGYLEKYALIDETPVVEMEPTDGNVPEEDEEGARILSQDLYDLGDLLSKPEEEDNPNSEEEITDFLRASDNSSPIDVDPFPQSLVQEEPKLTKRSKSKTQKKVSIKVEKVADPLSISSFEFPSEEPDWGTTDDDPTAMDEKDEEQESKKQDSEVQKPVAPPRKKSISAPKVCLDLTPLTRVDDVITQEPEEAGGKEGRVEEKEMASPAETADEGDGDGEDTMQPSCNVAQHEDMPELASEEIKPSQAESMKDTNEVTVMDALKDAAEEEKDTKIVEQSETVAVVTEPEVVDIKPSRAAETVETDKKGDTSTAVPSEQAKDRGSCIIL